MIEDRLATLSLEQKVRLLTGATFWSLHAEPAIGLRRIVVSDGPAGVRGELWDERDPSANIPSPTALAATWDEVRNERLGRLLAVEARRKGVDVLLAPTVNLHRSPYGGRHFECLSEDPLLTARIGAAFVRGVQGGGVAATVKHFVANDSETERITVDARVDERALRELYLAPFEALTREAGAWAVMAAYNRVNGTTMTEHPLLSDVLRDEWGFDGLVMSDWFATRSTVATGNGGLDLAMPGPISPWRDELVAAVRRDEVAESAVDEKVRRVLRLAARVGALAGIPPPQRPRRGATTRPPPNCAPPPPPASCCCATRTDYCRSTRAAIHRVAVVGPNAAVARTLGGGSALVLPPYTVGPVDGLRAALGPDVEIGQAEGVRSSSRLTPASLQQLRLPDRDEHGVQVRFLAADGAVLGVEDRRGASFTWLGSYGEGLPLPSVDTIEVRTRFRAASDGDHELGCSALGRAMLYVGDEKVLDTVLALPAEADPVEGLIRPPQASAVVALRAGDEVSMVLRVAPRGEIPVAALQLNVEPPRGAPDAELEAAVRLATDADVAVVVVGTTEEVESEGFDRDGLGLPGNQDELVRRVAAANPRTVVVVNAGAPVLLPWAEHVPAVRRPCSPGRSSATPWPTSSSAGSEPGGRLPASGPPASTARSRPCARPTACCATTSRSTSASAPTTAPASRPRSRSATDWGTRRGSTTASTIRPSSTKASHCACG